MPESTLYAMTHLIGEIQSVYTMTLPLHAQTTRSCLLVFVCEIDKSELDDGLWTHIYSAPWRKHGEDITYREGKLRCLLPDTACETHPCTTRESYCSSIT